MNVMTWESLFGRMTGIQNKRRSLKNAQWQTLAEDTLFGGQVYAKGSQYKYWEGRDFGYVVFHKDSKTPEGHTPGQFIHRM
jgi:hypothetical protein